MSSPLRAAWMWVAIGLALSTGLGQCQPGEVVRVGIFFGENAPRSVVVRGQGAYRGETGQGGLWGSVEVRSTGRQLVVKTPLKEQQVGSWVEFRPASGEEQWLEVGERAYRGESRIEVQADGRLKVVNVLGVEDYVRGVVPNEMFAEPEAFKVQAVISRTLAVYVRDHEKRHAGDGFDLCTTGHCQVYRGVDSETPLADEAVKSTAGEVVTFRGRPILAAYHANAGGGTDEVDDVWPGSIKRDFIYLASVPSGFDTEANRLPGYEWCYRWQRTIDVEQVRERLAAAGKHVGQITDIAIRSKTRTGRVRLLEVVGTRGTAKVMGTSAVYETLGMPSSKLDLKKNGTEFVARGSGYGDGIGVSQHGALGMARVGYNHREILGYYYRGVSLAEDYGRGDSRSLPVPSVRLARR